VSVLTKVFVVLLVVFSIALSMLVVAAFARQEDWRASAIHWQEAALAEQAKARTYASSYELAQQQAVDQHRNDSKELNDLRGELAAKSAKIGELDRNLAETQNKLSSEQGSVAGLTNSLQIVSASLDHERGFNKKIAERNSELEKRNVDLNDRVKELTTNVAMAQAQVRALQQQITGFDEGRSAAATGLAPATQIPGGTSIVEAGVPNVQVSSATPITAPVRGEITRVQGNLASLSVGSADGVVPGMNFLVYRRSGSKPMYLGTVKITRVNANESAGTIEQSEGAIQAGDTARDEASLAMRR